MPQNEELVVNGSHWDHDGGNGKFASLKPGVPIIGGKGDGVKAATREVTGALEISRMRVTSLNLWV